MVYTYVVQVNDHKKFRVAENEVKCRPLVRRDPPHCLFIPYINSLSVRILQVTVSKATPDDFLVPGLAAPSLSLGLIFVTERLTCKFKKTGELDVGIFSSQ